VDAIAQRSTAPVSTTADSRVDPLFREAAAMAILGCLAQDGVRIALPHVTGAREPILWEGSWTNLPPARTLRSPTAPT
jgi:1,6-anhydro-N-acetylmuramate kinase